MFASFRRNIFPCRRRAHVRIIINSNFIVKFVIFYALFFFSVCFLSKQNSAFSVQFCFATYFHIRHFNVNTSTAFWHLRGSALFFFNKSIESVDFFISKSHHCIDLVNYPGNKCNNACHNQKSKANCDEKEKADVEWVGKIVLCKLHGFWALFLCCKFQSLGRLWFLFYVSLHLIDFILQISLFLSFLQKFLVIC